MYSHSTSTLIIAGGPISSCEVQIKISEHILGRFSTLIMMFEVTVAAESAVVNAVVHAAVLAIEVWQVDEMFPSALSLVASLEYKVLTDLSVHWSLLLSLLILGCLILV